jgi:hypothetical protein
MEWVMAEWLMVASPVFTISRGIPAEGSFTRINWELNLGYTTGLHPAVMARDND